jgi:hypothetical protein
MVFFTRGRTEIDGFQEWSVQVGICTEKQGKDSGG